MRKYLSVLLALVLLLGLCACGGKESKKDEQTENKQSATTVPVDPAELYDWIEVSGGLEITAYLGSDTKVVVPSAIDHKAVVSVGTAFSGDLTLEELELPKAVTAADLTNCQALKRLTAPGITSLKKLSLEGCDTLEYLSLEGIKEAPTTQLPPSVRELVLCNLKNLFLSDFPFGCDSLEKADLSGANVIYDGSAVYDEYPYELTLNEDLNKCYLIRRYDESTGAYTDDFCKIYKEGGDFGDMYVSDGYRPNDDIPETLDITDENRAQIYCGIFNCNKITVNGVVYTYEK